MMIHLSNPNPKIVLVKTKKEQQMKKLRTKKNGLLTEKDLSYFGGAYSLWEKIKKKGVGSPRIIYQSGIEAFDELYVDTANEIGFVNFELLKNGLILRLNVRQKTSCIGIRLSEIKKIHLIGYPIEVKGNKNVYRGELKIVESESVLNFSVLTRDFKKITGFFEKAELVSRFNYSLRSEVPESDDDDPILKIIDILDIFF